MISFKKFYKLNEMPYYVDNSEKHMFDLEIEKRDLKDLETIILMILSGYNVVDKYKNNLKLTNDIEKNEFINYLKDENGLAYTNIIGKYGRKLKIGPTNKNEFDTWLNNIIIKSKNIK